MLRQAVGREWSALGAALALAAQAWSGVADASVGGPAAGGAGGLGLQLGYPRTLLRVGHSYAATIDELGKFKDHGFVGGRRGDHVTIDVVSAGHLTVSLDASGESHDFDYGQQGAWTAS